MLPLAIQRAENRTPDTGQDTRFDYYRRVIDADDTIERASTRVPGRHRAGAQAGKPLSSVLTSGTAGAARER